MIESIFNKYSGVDALKNAVLKDNDEVLQVNGHFHTPYSFSAFTEISQALKMAKEENVKVLGINDFYTTNGYEEFTKLCESYNIFPLYNIEFMALQKDLQAKGVRVNDPNNPGRTYFSGKGLKFPILMNAEMVEKLLGVQNESNRQTEQMVEKLNEFLKELGADFSFDYDDLMKKYAKYILRERHIAKALRIAIAEKFATEEEQKAFYVKVFSGKEPKSAMSDFVGLENEIRGNLLKTGGRAFVPEDDKAFLALDEVIDFIIKAGGIPCYPVLLDNPKGEFTDFEGDYQALYESLVAKNVYSLELIPGRNKPEIMEEFVNFFNDKGFVITLGTEHNTPKLDPITIYGGDGKDLSPAMKKINYEGACVVAAHQFLKAKDEEGFLRKDGTAKIEQRADFIALGDAIIKKFVTE